MNYLRSIPKSNKRRVEKTLAFPYTYTRDNNWIYHNAEGNSVRYVLGKMGQNPVICFGINPSTATPEKLDRTLQSVDRISSNNHFDGWIMFNVYPIRETQPGKMPEIANDKHHAENLKVISKIIKELNTLYVWCAWGDSIKTKPYLTECFKQVFRLFEDKNVTWLCAEATNSGHPRHPLYRKSDTILQKFDMNTYIKTI